MSVLMTPAADAEAVRPGAMFGLDLADTVTLTSTGEVIDYAAEVTGHLWTGTAEVVTTAQFGASPMLPVALVVGAWAVPEPCCAGHQAPSAERERICMSPARAAQRWACGGCGKIMEPTVWATMQLVGEGADGTGTRWELPAAHETAKAADIGWERWLAATRFRASRDAERVADKLVELLEASSDDVVEVRKELPDTDTMFGRPTRHGIVEAALQWGAQRDHPSEGKIAVGHYVPVQEPAKRATFELRFETVDWLDVTAAEATRLWDEHTRRLADIKPNRDALVDIWTRCTGVVPPSWVVPELSEHLGRIHDELDRVQRASWNHSRGRSL